MKGIKWMVLRMNGSRYICMMVKGENNPFWLYKVHCENGRMHQKLITKYANEESVLWRVLDEERR